MMIPSFTCCYYFFVFTLLFVSKPTLGNNCTLTVQDWNKIKLFLHDHNFVQDFINDGDCDPNNKTGLLFKYGGCTQTLAQLVQNENLEPSAGSCQVALQSILFSGDGQTASSIATIANTICTRSGFGDTISSNSQVGYFCFPGAVVGCPSIESSKYYVSFPFSRLTIHELQILNQSF